MAEGNYITDAPNTWCPGCGNFIIQHVLKRVLKDAEERGDDMNRYALVAGIGCHGKIADYMNINSIYSLHGRPVAFATGVKIADPGLNVICCTGDGDSYAEGLEHLLFAAKRNLDITVIVHDNRVYGLTTGQYTPTSPGDYRGKSNPEGGNVPFNPMRLMLCSGATYIARGYTGRMKQLEDLVKGAMDHKGFSVVEVLQICASYFNKKDFYNEHVYEYEGDPSSAAGAFSAAGEWDYNSESPIPLGLFYREERAVFEDRFSAGGMEAEERRAAVMDYLKR